MRTQIKQWTVDILYATLAGLIVGLAYYFFQNSNGFAPGGVGGLATITYFLLDYKISWAILMLAFNIPIYSPSIYTPGSSLLIIPGRIA